MVLTSKYGRKVGWTIPKSTNQKRKLLTRPIKIPKKPESHVRRQIITNETTPKAFTRDYRYVEWQWEVE